VINFTKTLLISLPALSCFANSQAQKPSSKTPAAAQTYTDPNPSARFGTCKDYNFFATAELVYFQPLTSELSQQQEGSYTTSDVKTQYFQNAFKPGVRASLGCNTPYDGWDLSLIYTGLNYNHANSFKNTGIGVPVWGTFSDNGNIKYTYYYNQGDLDLGRMFKVSKQLRLRPHMGVRGLWLTQKATINYTNSLGNLVYNMNRYQGTLFGLEGGFDSNWMLSKNFSVIANLGFTGLVNSQKASGQKLNYSTNATESMSSNYGSKLVYGFDWSVGLGYDTDMCNDNYHIGIKLAYEQHSLMSINSTADRTYLIGTSGFYPLQETDFRWQAVTLGLRFDF